MFRTVAAVFWSLFIAVMANAADPAPGQCLGFFAYTPITLNERPWETRGPYVTWGEYQVGYSVAPDRVVFHARDPKTGEMFAFVNPENERQAQDYFYLQMVQTRNVRALRETEGTMAGQVVLEMKNPPFARLPPNLAPKDYPLVTWHINKILYYRFLTPFGLNQFLNREIFAPLLSSRLADSTLYWRFLAHGKLLVELLRMPDHDVLQHGPALAELLKML